MEKFWNYLRDKNKAGLFGKDYCLIQNNMVIHDVPKQMLIGYMIEYLFEDKFVFASLNFVKLKDITDIYNYLVNIIEEI